MLSQPPQLFEASTTSRTNEIAIAKEVYAQAMLAEPTAWPTRMLAEGMPWLHDCIWSEAHWPCVHACTKIVTPRVR